MADKLLLCISATQAAAARWRGGRLSAPQVFASNEAGWTAFHSFLQTLPVLPVLLMVDAVGEDYRCETLPHSYGTDRREMVQRRLRQQYRNTTYCCASMQGREESRRRDDRFLFAALTGQELLGNWLQAIAARGLPLAGIYLLPMVSTALLDKLAVRTPAVLLVSQHSSGLRQTFFRDRRLRTSRLTPLEINSGESPAGAYAEEIANTRLYLEALRVLPRDEPLLAVILDQDDSLAGLDKEVSLEATNIQCQRFSRDAIVSRAGLALSHMQQSPEALHLHLLGMQVPACNLAPASLTAGYRHYRARRTVLSLAAGIAAVALVWSAANVYRESDYRNQAAQLAVQAAAEQEKYLDVAKSFPAAPASAENLQQAVETAQKIREVARTPELALQVIARALDASPEVALKSVRWNCLAADTPAAQAAAKGHGQGAFIEGEIAPFKGDYRAAVASIRSFAQRLAADNAVAAVTSTQLPLDINSSSSLSGSTSDSRELSPSAPFKLTLVLR